MFSFINRLIWKKDPADAACDEVVDIIRRYQRLSDDERDEVASAFEHTKSQLEIQHGETSAWGTQHKAAIAEQVLRVAKEGYEAEPVAAYGVALVGLWLEAQTLPGEKAERLVHLISEWHRRTRRPD